MGCEGEAHWGLGGWGVAWGGVGRVSLLETLLIHLHLSYCIQCFRWSEADRKEHMFSALRRWVRTHGVYKTLIVMPDSCKVHLSWTKSQALTWMYLHSRKDKVAKQQFSKVTNLFGQRVAVRYYR